MEKSFKPPQVLHKGFLKSETNVQMFLLLLICKIKLVFLVLVSNERNWISASIKSGVGTSAALQLPTTGK